MWRSKEFVSPVLRLKNAPSSKESRTICVSWAKCAGDAESADEPNKEGIEVIAILSCPSVLVACGKNYDFTTLIV